MQHYLTYSIFYNKKEWYKLLDQPYLSIVNDSTISSTFIKLNCERGAHIELTTVVEDINKKKSVNRVSSILTAFLEEWPSSKDGLESQSQSDLMLKDFSNNTIHYGVHDCPILRIKEDEIVTYVHTQISEVIVLIFKEYKEETVEMITEVILEVFSVFCLIAYNDIDKSIDFFERLLEKESANYNKKFLEKQLKISAENFESNKEDIVNYFKNVLIDKTEFPKEKWATKWKTIVEYISGKQDAQDENKKELLYESLINLFCKHINFEDKIDAYVIQLNALKEISK